MGTSERSSGGDALASETRSIADSVRALVLNVVAHVTEPATTEDLADAAEDLADVLEQAVASGQQRLSESESGNRTHPVSGSANPLAAPLTDDADGGLLVSSGVFTATHEGPPGCVHGGAIAAGFEHVVARVEAHAGLDWQPRTVRIHYRRPTLLGIPLRFEAEKLGPASSRVAEPGEEASFEISARLIQDNEVTCEAMVLRPPEATD